MDLSLDELIKKNKPEKKHNNSNTNSSKGNNNSRNRNKSSNKNNSFKRNTNNNSNNNNNKKKRGRDNYDDNNKKSKKQRHKGQGGDNHFKKKKNFNFKPQWRGDHVALQLDGIDMVMINVQGKIILTTAGDPSKRSLLALNHALRQFNLNVQPSMGGQWTIYDTEVPEYRQQFFDGVFVLDAKRDPGRMRQRWVKINKAYGRDADAEAKKALDNQLLQRKKEEEEERKKMESYMWIRPKNVSEQDLYDDERKQLPLHEQSGSIYFLRGLSKRKGWDEPTFEQETNEDGLIGYSVKLAILDDIIAPSEWFEDDASAMVSVADEALEIVKAWHYANQEDGENEGNDEEGSNDTVHVEDDQSSNSHVWRPGQ